MGKQLCRKKPTQPVFVKDKGGSNLLTESEQAARRVQHLCKVIKCPKPEHPATSTPANNTLNNDTHPRSSLTCLWMSYSTPPKVCWGEVLLGALTFTRGRSGPSMSMSEVKQSSRVLLTALWKIMDQVPRWLHWSRCATSLPEIQPAQPQNQDPAV